MSNSLPKDERFTPKKYIESVRFVLGKIDLDPATSFLANKRVKANAIFTKENSGLDKKWFGNVYCNPPYSRGNLIEWSAKARFEFEQQNAKNEVLLVPNGTDTEWFKILNEFPFCLTDHRIPFLYYDEKLKKFFYLKNPENGSCFFLLSNDILIYQRFCDEFSKYGPIFRRVFTRR